MALAQIGKQLAQQALGNQMKDILAPPPAPPGVPENVGSGVIGQIQAMQRACKEDQELVVTCTAGVDTLRVHEIYAPSWQVLVLTGMDADRNLTRVVSPADAVQLICKVMAVQAGTKAMRINFIIPKPKA